MSKVAFIIGTGRGIGASVAAQFVKSGYQVATASRSEKPPVEQGTFHVQVDLSLPEDVDEAFDKVAKKYGPPSVVVYNAVSLTVKGDDLFAISVDEYRKDILVNNVAVFAAAKAAHRLKKDVTFIYTGNRLNVDVVPSLLTLGVGKSASAHLLRALSEQYAKEGARFFYVDERSEIGGFPQGVSRLAHAELYLELAEAKEKLNPVIYTFVKGKGRVDF